MARYARLIADIEKALEKSIDAAKVVLHNKIKNLRTTATKRARKLLDGHQARMGILTKRRKIEDARGKTAPQELVKATPFGDVLPSFIAGGSSILRMEEILGAGRKGEHAEGIDLVDIIHGSLPVNQLTKHSIEHDILPKNIALFSKARSRICEY